MSVISNYVDCHTLQDQINGYFGCDKSILMKLNETSLTQFLMSPANTNNVLAQSVSPGNGKLRSVELTYIPRILTNDVGTTIVDTCVATSPYGNRSKTYTIDPLVGVYQERYIDVAELATMCEADESYIGGMLNAMMNAAVRKMDVVLASQVSLLAGEFGVGETNVSGGVKTVRTRRSSTDNGLSTDFISGINFASENAGYCAAPVAFGYGEMWKAAIEINAACCADNGTNVAMLNQITDITFMPNRSVPTALTGHSPAAQFLTLDPGAVQILSYLKYQGANGIRVINDEAYKQTVIIDPATGIAFDFRMVNTCGKLHFFISKSFKAVGVPTDLFYDGDVYDGTTGVNLYNIVNT